MANPLRLRCELISTNVEENKLFICMIRKQVKLKKKSLFRRLIKLITSDEDINFGVSFNLAANKQHGVVRKIKIEKKND